MTMLCESSAGDSVNSGGGGGEFGQFSKFQEGLRNFQDPGG